MKKINLAFYINFNHKKWLGGLNIILNLANYLAENRKTLNHNYNIILISKDEKIKEDFNISNKIKIIYNNSLYQMGLWRRILEKIHLLLFGKTLILEKFLKENDINYLSHTNIATGKHSFCKSIVWIPDFQYLHLPKLFSFKYKLFKKINLFLYSIHAHKILLSSDNARKDLKRISKIPTNKIFVNKFVFSIKDPRFLPNKNKLLKKYKISSQYIFLPNQYWVHKNHLIVLKALKFLGKKNLKRYNIQIISSGSNVDYRDPNHFRNIINYLKDNDLKKYYKYLGLIKYDEVLSLIYNSKCILNPSLFEGWSSTVEQAKAYGKYLILSNIGVHLEQNPRYCNYFNPNKSENLAKLILNVYKSKKLYKQKFEYKLIEKKINKKIFEYSKKFCQKVL